MADIPTLEAQEYEAAQGQKAKESGKPAMNSAAPWLDEIEKAGKRDKSWIDRGRRIVKRYRDDRGSTDATVRSGKRRFNILWSNVQTLKPAVYGRRPLPICERRFLDHDPTARIASTILERTLRFDIEENGFHEHVNRAVDDLLLPGRGVVWLRYEPSFGEAPAVSPEPEGGSIYDEGGAGSSGQSSVGAPVTANGGAAGGGSPGPGSLARTDAVGDAESPGVPPIVDECVYYDYIFWEDLRTSEARNWSEVTWVGVRRYMGKGELKRRAEETGENAWLKVPITKPKADSGRKAGRADGRDIEKGEVWEIWNMEDREVLFVAEGCPDIIETRPDPLGIEGFWPTPRPLYSTQTNETLEPVPDYAEYQDQAEELDSLTNRINSLMKSLKVVGAYDASAPGLQRILDEGHENKLVPVENWAAFAEKGGIDGAITWLPIKEIAAVLIQLFEARERIKQDLYEITGISDIIRGQSESVQPATATEQQIKGQFATQRLNARQAEVARYCRDLLGIHAEIAAEHYAPETLILKSSIMEDDGLTDDETAETEPGMGHNGGPPMDGMMAPPVMAPPVDPMEAKMEQIAAAIALLKNEKLRGFRVDIETDSTIALDAQQGKEQAVEFITAVTGYVEKAGMMIQAVPQSAPFLGKLLQWGIRQFRSGRDMESAADEFVEAMGTLAKAASEGGEQDPAVASEAAKAQADMQITQAETQAKMVEIQAKSQAEAATAQIKQQTMLLDAQIKLAELQAKERLMARQEEIAAAEHSRAMQMGSLDIMRETEGHNARMAEQQASHSATLEGIDAKKTATIEAARAKPKPANGGTK